MSEIERVGATDLPEISPEVERVIWKGLGRKSAKVIAEETGLSPVEVLRWKKELLEGVDELTIQEKRVKLMADLQDVADRARDLAEASISEFQAGLLNSSVAAMKALLVETARLEKADNSKVEALNQLRVRELLNLLTAVVDAGVEEISEAYELDPDDLIAVFNRKLVEEAEKRDMT